MTLVFDFPALRQCVNPHAVVTGAKQWSQQVGLVTADEPEAVFFTQMHQLPLDFTRPRTGETFADLRERFTSDRNVLVQDPATSDDLDLGTDWNRLSIEHATDQAGWELRGGNEGQSLWGTIDRLRGLFDR
jgi:hypothetical protein